MPVPTPEVPLENVCTTIYNNTLYTYSSAAFQSLELREGAQWKKLAMGVRVDNGVCVKTTPVNATDASALWIVGGTASESYYTGLQKYTFKNASWEVIKTMDPVAQNRMWHGATYLNKSDTILMFAGTQDGIKQASSQTFTINASPPYAVAAYDSKAPPAVKPMVLGWSSSKAIYVGGSETNKQVMVFSPSNGWQDTNATLAMPFYNCSHVQAVLQNGNDASKTLYTFDMTVQPTSVNRTILIDENGNPVTDSAPVKANDVRIASNTTRNSHALLDDRSLVRRGNLTIANWPMYNDSLAPLSTRENFAVARDQSGMTVITGGNQDDILCIFKARDNCWLNATEKFTAKAALTTPETPDDTPTTVLPTNDAAPPSATASGTESSKSIPNSTSDSPKIMGVIAGSVFGAALIVIAILIFLRWRKKRQNYFDLGHQRRSSGLSNSKMDFQDRGLPTISTTRQFRHEPTQSAGSISSMALLIDRIGVGHKRGKENGSTVSDSSSQFNKDYKSAIGKPQMMPNINDYVPEFIADEKAPLPTIATTSVTPRPRVAGRPRPGSTRRSSGWNKYWSGGTTMGFFGFGKRNTTAEDQASDRSSGSRYSTPQESRQMSQPSAMVPPLQLGARPQVQRVNSSTPTFQSGNQFPFPRASVGQLKRPGSVSTLSSFDGQRDAFSSGVPESVYDEFTTTRQSSTIFPDRRDTQLPRPPLPPSYQNSTVSTDMSWLNLGDQRRI